MGCDLDLAKVSLTGIALGQAAAAILAVLEVSGEYRTGLDPRHLTAMPRWATVLAAKAVVVSGLVLVAGTVAVLVCVLAGAARHAWQRFHRSARLPRPVAGRRAGVACRRRLGALPRPDRVARPRRRQCRTAGCGSHRARARLLYLFPIIASVVTDPDWYRHLQQIAPMTAGLAVQATINLGSQPIGPWAGLGVLAAFATGALLVGGLLLPLRDV